MLDVVVLPCVPETARTQRSCSSDEDEARDILRESPGIMVIDKREDGGYVSPVECVGDYATFISRIRQDVTVDNGINLWCVSDNLRKGAALNAVQIAEVLGNKVLKKG
jgi:aspartate-semialdehyde dehydrogenase